MTNPTSSNQTPSEEEAKQALRYLRELASLHSTEATADAYKIALYIASLQIQCSALQREKERLQFKLDSLLPPKAPNYIAPEDLPL